MVRPPVIAGPPSDHPACVGLTVPYTHFVPGEAVEAQFLPAGAAGYELELRTLDDGSRRVLAASANRLKLTDLVVGRHQLRSRWRAAGEGDDAWSPWSRPLTVTIQAASSATDLHELRVKDHRMSLLIDRDLSGVVTVTDPWALPPNCPEDARWFRTACHEGVPMLLNEEPAYYRDPLAYYVSCIRSMLDAGVRLVTWHDVLDGRIGQAEREAIVQFDLDAGPRSFARLYEALEPLGICATLMVSCECHDWYDYRLEDLDLDLFKRAERAGWAVGYHNNALTNAQQPDRFGDYGEDILAEASRRFAEDLARLREHFNVRTFTHHGGNVFNWRTPVPEGLGVVGVDRGVNPELWTRIAGAFSDGGFLSRPVTLAEKVRTLPPGLHFFRNHPVKYGNFVAPFDVPPIDEADVESRGGVLDDAMRRWVAAGIEKQERWLALRDEHRLSQRLSDASPHKPISRRLRPYSVIAERVESLRSSRGANFLREYPWALGDPRVFWWRMLDALAPRSGALLNVGALQPERRAETTAFLPEGVEVLEMDIDPKREPHVLGDMCNPPASLESRFDGVLLLGLPYFHSPGRAIAGCLRALKPGGVGLFGFAAHTHPTRGALWRPETRPLWRPGLEPLEDIGLKGRLWSFDEQAVAALFRDWPGVDVARDAEFFSHYWFVVATRSG